MGQLQPAALTSTLTASFVCLCLLGMRLIVLAFKILPDLFLVIRRRNCLPSGEPLRLTDVSVFSSHVVQVDLEDLTVFVQGCLVTLVSWAALHIFSRSDSAAFCLEIHIYILTYKNIFISVYYIYLYIKYYVYAEEFLHLSLRSQAA